MRSTLTAMLVAAGVFGLGSFAQAAPVPAGAPGLSQSPVELVQMTRHKRHSMKHRMRHHGAMKHHRMKKPMRHHHHMRRKMHHM